MDAHVGGHAREFLLLILNMLYTKKWILTLTICKVVLEISYYVLKALYSFEYSFYKRKWMLQLVFKNKGPNMVKYFKIFVLMWKNKTCMKNKLENM
jgi:hypothetical protein